MFIDGQLVSRISLDARHATYNETMVRAESGTMIINIMIYPRLNTLSVKIKSCLSEEMSYSKEISCVYYVPNKKDSLFKTSQNSFYGG
jgi:hypothetical protein